MIPGCSDPNCDCDVTCQPSEEWLAEYYAAEDRVWADPVERERRILGRVNMMHQAALQLIAMRKRDRRRGANIDWGSPPPKVGAFWAAARAKVDKDAAATRLTCAYYGVDIPYEDDRTKRAKWLDKVGETLEGWSQKDWSKSEYIFDWDDI